MISFKQAIGWVQPRGQQDIKLWDDTISAVNKSPIIGKADLGFISSITSINKLERIWFYEYFKDFKEPSEDMKNGSKRHIFDFRFEHQTGSELFFMDRKLKILEPEVRNIPDRKRIEF